MCIFKKWYFFIYKEVENILLELKEDYLDQIKNRKRTNLEKFSNK